MVNFLNLIGLEIPKFSYPDGTDAGSLEDVPLPDLGWEWQDNEWTISKGDSTDKNGWEYAKSFGSSTWSNKNNMVDVVRRRLWKRVCKKQDVVKND